MQNDPGQTTIINERYLPFCASLRQRYYDRTRATSFGTGGTGAMSVKQVRVFASHTAGEPTRVVIDGGPDLGGGTVAKRLDRFRSDCDRFRSGVVNEPRGSDVLVGALLCEPLDSSCAAGVIFFNNIGTIRI